MDSFAAFILAHEDFAESLKITAEKITGLQPNIFAYTNKIDSLPVIIEKINKKLASIQSDKIFVFADLIGGSCWSLANMIAREHPEVKIIGGVNLPMVISLIINHEKLVIDQLTEKIIEDSKKGIKEFTRK
jgi:fructoselysine and glucoselysine-specific PTS system IIA component